MLKLLLWGIIGYIVYRYFQMKEQIKESRRQEALHENRQRQADQASQSAGNTKERKKTEGDYIDYEEVK